MKWDIHLLDRAIGTDKTPYTLSEGMIVCRSLPFLAVGTKSKVPAEAVVLKSWTNYHFSRVVIICGLDIADAQDAHVLGLSFALRRRDYNPTDPLLFSVKSLVDKGRVVVVAAGNWGPGAGTLSELAGVPGVIVVGATTHDGKILSVSSRGTSDGLRPTVVADGEDYVVPDPFPAGTSFAVVQVKRFCLLLRAMAQWLSREFMAAMDSRGPIPLPVPSRLATLDTAFNRRIIETKTQQKEMWVKSNLGDPKGTNYAGGTGHRYTWYLRVWDRLRHAGLGFALTSNPASIYRLLTAIAKPASCSEPAACGAGFITEDYINEYFTNFTASRFYAAFGNVRTLNQAQERLLRDLDNEAGPLWDSATYRYANYLFLEGLKDYVAPRRHIIRHERSRGQHVNRYGV